MGNEVWNKYMKKELVSILININAIKYGKFNLASGKESNYYIDIKKVTTDPKVLSVIASKIVHIASPCYGFDAVAGIEIGGVPLATAVSLNLDIPMVIIRKESKDYGMGGYFIGEVKEKNILLLEDVTTTGGSALSGVEKIRDVGGTIDTIITVFDRIEGARENLKEINVDLISLVDRNDLL